MNRWIDARSATMEEIETFARDFPFAVLPVGSFEQHGHEPGGYDSR